MQKGMKNHTYGSLSANMNVVDRKACSHAMTICCKLRLFFTTAKYMDSHRAVPRWLNGVKIQGAQVGAPKVSYMLE